MQEYKLNIVIISYNCLGHTVNCIRSILDTCKGIEYIITVVDNASGDDTVKVIREDFPDINLIVSETNLGYAGAVNLGAGSIESEYILISNADVIYKEDSINKLLQYLEKRNDIGAVGPQQVFPDGSWQPSYGDYPGVALGFKDLLFSRQFKSIMMTLLWKILPLERTVKDVPFLDGACILTRKALFDSINGFDTDFFFYTEETDFCKRLVKAGYRIVFYPKSRIIHYRGGSSGYTLSENSARMLTESKIRFCRKHYPEFHTRTFIRLEYWHYSILYILSGIFRFIQPDKNSGKDQITKRIIRDILRQNL